MELATGGQGRKVSRRGRRTTAPQLRQMLRRIDAIRDEVWAEVRDELSPVPRYLVVEPDANTGPQVAALLQQASSALLEPEVCVVRHPNKLSMVAADVWLVSVRVDAASYDGVSAFRRLAQRYPQAALVAWATGVAVDPAIWDLSVRWLVRDGRRLPDIVSAVAAARETLPPRQHRRRVRARVRRELGNDGLQLAGFDGVDDTDPVETLEQVQRRAVQRALARNNGCVAGAARDLQVDRKTVERWRG